MHAFPQLQHDRHCDVTVIGGGISGALIANELAGHGHDVVVVEQRDIGWGSSAASTALLQYEIDTHMTELTTRFGEADAVLAYRACAEAIKLLQALAGEVGDVDFGRMRSLAVRHGLWRQWHHLQHARGRPATRTDRTTPAPAGETVFL